MRSPKVLLLLQKTHIWQTSSLWNDLQISQSESSKSVPSTTCYYFFEEIELLWLHATFFKACSKKCSKQTLFSDNRLLPTAAFHFSRAPWKSASGMQGLSIFPTNRALTTWTPHFLELISCKALPSLRRPDAQDLVPFGIHFGDDDFLHLCSCVFMLFTQQRCACVRNSQVSLLKLLWVISWSIIIAIQQHWGVLATVWYGGFSK